MMGKEGGRARLLSFCDGAVTLPTPSGIAPTPEVRLLSLFLKGGPAVAGSSFQVDDFRDDQSGRRPRCLSTRSMIA